MEDIQVTPVEGGHVAFKRLLWAAPAGRNCGGRRQRRGAFRRIGTGGDATRLRHSGIRTDNVSAGRLFFLDRGSRSRNGLHGHRFIVAAADTDLPHRGGGGAGAVVRDTAHYPRVAALDDPDTGAHARGCRGDHYQHAYDARPRNVVPVEA